MQSLLRSIGISAAGLAVIVLANAAIYAHRGPVQTAATPVVRIVMHLR